MTTLEKFEDFLRNPSRYKELEHFWSNEISKILHTKPIEWIGNEFANGEKISDGNPIFSFWQPRKKKSVRIIQNDINPLEKEFVCWIYTTFDQNNNRIKELVLSLQLNHLTLQTAKEFISLFLKNELTKKDIEKINAEYEMLLSSRVHYLTNFVKNIHEKRIPSIKGIAHELQSPLSQMQQIQRLNTLQDIL